jgi:hypothetical protein
MRTRIIDIMRRRRSLRFDAAYDAARARRRLISVYEPFNHPVAVLSMMHRPPFAALDDSDSRPCLGTSGANGHLKAL